LFYIVIGWQSRPARVPRLLWRKIDIPLKMRKY
jgi:hypothetical protein